jgi:hypothetical protein
MAQVQARVATCVPLGTGPLGKTETAGAPNRCIREDGVTVGDIVFVTAYLSDQPVVVDPSSGGGACTNPFSMSAEDGGLLSAAIVGCWAAAYFVRSVINVVSNGVES